jgi:hypothetical protein
MTIHRAIRFKKQLLILVATMTYIKHHLYIGPFVTVDALILVYCMLVRFNIKLFGEQEKP